MENCSRSFPINTGLLQFDSICVSNPLSTHPSSLTGYSLETDCLDMGIHVIVKLIFQFYIFIDTPYGKTYNFSMHAHLSYAEERY